MALPLAPLVSIGGQILAQTKIKFGKKEKTPTTPTTSTTKEKEKEKRNLFILLGIIFIIGIVFFFLKKK